MPASPKPPGQRRRRNLDSTKWRSLPAAGSEEVAPELPGDDPDDWLDSTREWWVAIWASPMATAWLPADYSGLLRLARLKDQDDRGEAPATALLAIQALEDRYGLSPKARQQLHWQIEQPTPEPETRARPQRGGRRLRAVDPSAA